MADDHDEWAARLPQLLVSGFNETAADPLALKIRQHRHRAERGSAQVADLSRTVEDVSDDAVVEARDQ